MARQRESQKTKRKQHSVRAKIILALQFSKCITYLEKFPGLNVRTVSPDSNDTECVRCIRDKRIPKLYPSMNNMNPGPVPPELQVSVS